MEDLMTKSDVAKHWKVSQRTVDQYRQDGIVQACNLPIVRFNPQHIRELDGVRLEKFSPLERKKLERELEYWKERALKAEIVITKMTILGNETLCNVQKDEQII